MSKILFSTTPVFNLNNKLTYLTSADTNISTTLILLEFLLMKMSFFIENENYYY
jgi:hypothetical protein